jgi:hypothetical protein
VANPFTAWRSRVTVFAGITSIILFLCFLGACGGSQHTTVVPPPTPPSVPPPAPSDSPTAASSFGFQCGLEVGACGGANGTIAWPTAQAKPGLLRLHDAGTYWSLLEPGSGQYDWTTLDNWLDTIAAHEPIDVSQVFIWVPCWDASTCSAPPVTPTGTNAPPSDLTASGSPSFNAFVTQFVQHCSPNNNCAKNIIKYYEMWNEWDLQFHWTGTPLQLYQMLAPAVTIIRNNVPNAVILTPSATTPTGLTAWLELENSGGKLSDWVDWHSYLSGSNPAVTNTPEYEWQNRALNLVNAQHAVPGWQSVPWANTETNFIGESGDLPYTCPPTEYTPDDCTGQIVRWQLLHASAGASSLVWYKWNITIGSNSQYETAYYYMMQYILGGKFTALCSSVTDNSGDDIWSCPFTESNGTTAAFVWAITPVEGNSTSYLVPSLYLDYKDLSGNTTTTSGGSSITIGPEPIMLEQ